MPTFHFTKKIFVISILCTLFIVSAAGWVFTGYLVELATNTVKNDVEDANLIISLNLTNELKKISNAAVAVAGSPLTLPVLQANNPENMEKINNILDRYHKSLDAAACYLIDRDGLTLTSSNRNAEDSFVGQNYTFRPYFQQAIKGDVGQHFAVGTVTGRRGFFASAPVRNKEGRIIGVVTIKKELDDIEIKLKQYIWFLIDQNGIIFLSSQPEARLKSLWPLGNELKQKIILSKQYGPGPFEPILQQLKAGEEVTFKGGQYLAAQHATPYDGISVVLLWPTERISMYRSFGIILTLLTILLTLSFLTVIYVFTQSNFRMKGLLEESQSQALALAASEQQLRARGNELEEQKELLVQTEERSRLILGSMSEGIFGIGNDGRVTFINAAASTILGYTEIEMIGKLMHTEVHHTYPDGSEFPRLQCPMYLTSQDGEARNVDSEVFWRKDGTAVPVEYSTTPIWKDGQVVATVVSFHDITERKQADALKVGKEVAEEALVRAEQARLEAESAQEELKAKMLEIERFNRLSLGRESRIIELKKQVNEIAVKADGKPIYQEQDITGDSDDLIQAQSPVNGLDHAEIPPQAMAEMLSVDQFQRLLEDFCDSVGIASAIIDLQGRVLASARWQRACTDFHRVNEKTCARCIESDTELALNLSEGKHFSVYRCKNGLTDAASPIIVEGKHIANTFVGQFFTSSPDMDYFRRQAEECGLDADQYLAAIRDVPVVAENKLQPVLGFLVGVAQTVAAMSMERNRAKQAETSIAKQIEMINRERTSAMSLAEDANNARTELELYKDNLEMLVQERTEALKQAGQEQVAIFESLTLGIAFVKDRIILRGNAKLGELFGRTLDEMVGQTTRIWYKNEEEYLVIGASTYDDLKRQAIHQREQELPRKDGSLFWCLFRVRALDAQDVSQGIVCTLEDITERKQAEKELKDRMEDLERFSRLTINREEKMIQLKEEINSLLEKTGREKKYKIVE